MARPREPINLLEAKGKKHLTKSEIEARKKSEISATATNIKPPKILSKTQKKEFKKIAKKLVELNIFSDLDCDTLARYVMAKEMFETATDLVNNISPNRLNLDDLGKAVTIQDKYFKQCRACANDLGLTITSRCRLVIPKKEKEPESKWAAFKSGEA